MIIGRMTETLILQRPNLVEDGRGGWKEGTGGKWATVATVWAEPRKVDVSREVVAGAVASDMTREWGIRYRTDVRKGWRALWGIRMLDVLHVYDYGRETTILVCREVVK